MNALVTAGRVIYGTNFRRGLAVDAHAMAELAPDHSMWSWAFTAIARVMEKSWAVHTKGIEEEWTKMVTMQGSACKAGGVQAAIWLGRAAVRLACKYQVLDPIILRQDVITECGVRVEDRVDVAAPEFMPSGVKRKRNGAKKADVEKRGGPVKEKELGNAAADEDAAEDEAAPADRPPGKKQTTLGAIVQGTDNSPRLGPDKMAGPSAVRSSLEAVQLATPVSQRHSRMDSSAGMSPTHGEAE